MFRELYKVEKLARIEGLDSSALIERRQAKSKPLMKKLHQLLLSIHDRTPPSSMPGVAANYALNQWPKPGVFLENGLIKLDTNDVENAIRPFVCGRKAWMFSGHPNGAEASAILYSIVETAKASGWNPYQWMVHVFDRLRVVKSEDDIRALLPSNNRHLNSQGQSGTLYNHSMPDLQAFQ